MWGLHRRLQNIFQFTVPVSGSSFSGSQAVFTEVSGTVARFSNYSGPTGGQATFTSASIGNLVASGTITTASLALHAQTASLALQAVSSSHALRADAARLQIVSNTLTSSVNIGTNNQFSNVLTIVLPVGTWMVQGYCTIAANSEHNGFMRISTGSVVYASQGTTVGGIISPYFGQATVMFPLIATESITLTMEATFRNSSGAPRVVASLNDEVAFTANTFPDNGDTATILTAYRID